jgi:glycosyltransferase involved in cell wall biosynthesis
VTERLSTDQTAVSASPPARPLTFPTLSVVIPVYNEAPTIRSVLASVLESPLVTEVILVDDGSTDGSGEILETLADPPRVRILRHPRNRGKGAALRSGFAVAEAEVVVVQDADLEYDPSDFPKLLRPFVDANADVVYGSRFLVGEYARVPLLHHYVGNRVLTFFSNLFTGLGLTDMETCYKAFRREILQGLRLRSERFTIEPELTAKVARVDGVRIFEVPINYRGRNHAEGKKISWRDGFSALWAIVRYRFSD